MKFHLALLAGAIDHSAFSISECCLGACQIAAVVMLEVLLPTDRRGNMAYSLCISFKFINHFCCWKMSSVNFIFSQRTPQSWSEYILIVRNPNPVPYPGGSRLACSSAIP